MSKKRITPDSNVQGEIVEDWHLLSVPVDSVIPDPERPNIRGKIVDTTDLQPSIREHGILQPILVREIPGKIGLYFRISGERRQVAARAVGLKEIPVIVGDGLKERDIRRIMFASDLHKREPHIVLDADGYIVAGKCKAVYEELTDEESETTRQDLAGDLGVSADVIGAYFCLFTDIPEIQEKVTNRQMAITVYSLVKHHGPEVKRYLAKKKGSVSATYVRETLKKWQTKIQPKLDAEFDAELDAEDNESPEEEKSETVKVIIKKRMTVTQLLNGSHDNLNKIIMSNGQLAGTDWTVVERIEAAIERIKNEV